MKNTPPLYWLVLILAILPSGINIAQDLIPGENPIIREVFTADPAALVYKDSVYLYVGHDEAREGQMFNINEWLAYSTADMKNWIPHGTIMKATDFKWSSGNSWASQVIEKDGKFWFYTTTMHGPPINKNAIGVAVANNPTGPFKDAKGSALVVDSMTPTPEDPHDWDDIDPTAFIDDDGTAWISWGNNHLYLAQLKPNMIELDGPIREIYLPNFTEGPWIHKRKDMYYLTYACFAHQGMWEKICYATAPEITGPWTYRGIITDQTENSYTIHPAIITFKGQWYFFYHNAKLTLDGVSGGLGRRAVAIEYLHYNDDGTIQPIEKTEEGLSVPPNPMAEYRSPIFNPDDSLVPVDSDLKVIQQSATAARSWPDNPTFSTTNSPYKNAIHPESFNRGKGASSIGQSFTVDSDVKLERISLYAGDGFGTGKNSAITLAIYDLGTTTVDNSYKPGNNLLGPEQELQINYTPQPPGLLHIDMAESGQPILKAGRHYVLEIQGSPGSAPLFWRRSQDNIYPKGAAYSDRSIIKTDNNATTSDFVMALFGRKID